MADSLFVSVLVMISRLSSLSSARGIVVSSALAHHVSPAPSSNSPVTKIQVFSLTRSTCGRSGAGMSRIVKGAFSRGRRTVILVPTPKVDLREIVPPMRPRSYAVAKRR